MEGRKEEERRERMKERRQGGKEWTERRKEEGNEGRKGKKKEGREGMEGRKENDYIRQPSNIGFNLSRMLASLSLKEVDKIDTQIDR